MRNDYLKEYCCQDPFSSLFLHPSNRTPTQPQARDLGVTDTQLFLILPEPHPTTLSFPFLLEPTSYAGGPSLPRFCAPQFQAPAVRGRLGAEALPSDVLPEGQWCLMLRRNARVIPPASLIAETFYPLASSQEGWVQCTKMFGERPRSLAFYDNRLL